MLDKAELHAYFQRVGALRWAGKSTEEKRAHAMMMVAARVARKKARAKKERKG